MKRGNNDLLDIYIHIGLMLRRFQTLASQCIDKAGERITDRITEQVCKTDIGVQPRRTYPSNQLFNWTSRNYVTGAKQYYRELRDAMQRAGMEQSLYYFPDTPTIGQRDALFNQDAETVAGETKGDTTEI